MTTNEIHVALLDEGVNVWRPVPALKVDADTYVILKPEDYDAEVEKWEFPPGSVVVVEERNIAEGRICAAVRRAWTGRLTA